ncbi:MAG: DUF4167 domain-containing protein [Rhodobacteraceae bacterium]|nr:DUF4167 domain-containing protein [Paracoccaceae bacterium]
MRSSKNRSRGKSNRNRNPGNNLNRVFDSSGPEGKVRGTPQQIIDKYSQLARDATLSNDRVAAENFQQHSEHYTRLLSEAQKSAEAKRVQAEQANRDRQQRDREEREARNARQEAASKAQPDDPANMPQPAAAPVEQPADSGAVSGKDDAQSGLVETPESKPKKRPQRARKPRVKPVPEAVTSEDVDPAPETPEAAE